MKDWSVRTRIASAFTAVLAVMLLVGVFTFHGLKTISTEAETIDTDVMPSIIAADSELVQAHDVLPKLIIEAFAAPADRDKASKETEREIGDLGASDTTLKKAALSTTEQDDYKAMVSTRTTFLDGYHATKAKGSITPADLGTLIPEFNRYTGAVDVLGSYNRGSGVVAGKNIRTSAASATTAMVTAMAVAMLVAFIAGWLLTRIIQQPLERLMAVTEVMRTGDFRQRVVLDRRDELGLLGERINLMANDLTGLIGQVQRLGIQVNSSSTEIAATAKEQQATASEIAATTSEVGATASRISATSKELAHTMNDLAGVAEQTASLATNGQSGLQRMESTMRQIMDASGSISSRLAMLSEKAGNINSVVTTINKVADQTNLLSLNAAIEAEKAGEHGRGFTVVATEIRRLADQTAVATYDIEQIVKEMQSAVSAGVMGMDKFSEEVRRGSEAVGQVTVQLSEIIQQVQTLIPSFESVNEGVQSQSVSAQQISEALAQLSDAAQQTAESLRQSNSAIEQLNEAARGLQGGISRFTLAT